MRTPWFSDSSGCSRLLADAATGVLGTLLAASVALSPSIAATVGRMVDHHDGLQSERPPIVAAALLPSGLHFESWPILVEGFQVPFFYATEAATNLGKSPFQNILAMGYHTLSPTIHRSPQCNSAAGFGGFCGDEVAFGSFTLQHDITGRDNTAIGDHALANLVSASGNTALGSSAAANIHTAGGVDAFGTAACQNAVDYSGPITCIGQAALEFAGPESRYAVALGYQAGLHTEDAEFSTMIGAGSGFNALTNSHSILVGDAACHNVVSVRNVICIGTINGPARGSMADTLWLGGNGGSTPILYGNLQTNALGLNTTHLTRGAALTVAGGDLALAPRSSLLWGEDSGISRQGFARIVVGSGKAGDDSGTVGLGMVDISSRVTLSARAEGELDVGAGSKPGTSGHIVAVYVRTVPVTVGQLSAIDPLPALGDRAFVTDATLCSFGVAVTKSGSVACPVYYNGTVWVGG